MRLPVVIQYSRETLNNIADGLAEFTKAEIVSINDRSDFVYDLIELGVIETLWAKLKPAYGRSYRQILRHLSASQRAHTLMSIQLAEFFQDHDLSSPKFLQYFDALASLENFVLHVHVAHDSFKEHLTYVDLQPEWRLELDRLSNLFSKFSNGIKHSSGKSKSQAARHLPRHSLFFVNEGVSDGTNVLTFTQMANFFGFMAEVSDELVDQILRLNPLKPVMVRK